MSQQTASFHFSRSLPPITPDDFEDSPPPFKSASPYGFDEYVESENIPSLQNLLSTNARVQAAAKNALPPVPDDDFQIPQFKYHPRLGINGCPCRPSRDLIDPREITDPFNRAAIAIEDDGFSWNGRDIPMRKCAVGGAHCLTWRLPDEPQLIADVPNRSLILALENRMNPALKGGE